MKIILDTDILSNIMRRTPSASAAAEKYLTRYPVFTFSIITYYEILRGLKTKDAQRQLLTFEKFALSSEIVPLTKEIGDEAAAIYESRCKTFAQNGSVILQSNTRFKYALRQIKLLYFSH